MTGWPTKPLLEVAAIVSNRIEPFEGKRHYVPTGGIDGGFVVASEEVAFNSKPSRADLVVKQNDVLFARMQATNKVVLVTNEIQDYIWSTGFAALRSCPHLRSRYLKHYLASPLFQKAKDAHCTGATQKSLPNAALKKLVIPFPPLSQQDRIAELLDEVVVLRELRAKADRRTASLVPALFHEMFGKAEYAEKTIGEFLEESWLLLHKDGNHGSLYPRASDFGDEGVPFLSATAITEKGAIDHDEVKRLSEAKAKQLRHGWIERGDVLLAHNASVGKVGFYEGDFYRALIGTSLTAFRVNPERMEPRYLWAALRDVFFQRQLEGIMKQALRNQVPITAQRELSLRVPPISLQREFAARVLDIRNLESEQATNRRRLDDLFQSMLYQAFNGEL